MSIGIYPNNYTTPKVSANPPAKAENATLKASYTENQTQPAAPNVDTFSSTVQTVRPTDDCGYVYTYEIMGNSPLRNVHDCPEYPISADSIRVGYYSDLMRTDYESANKILTQASGEFDTLYSYSVETALKRHEELRDEVYKTFGHDSELLSKNLDSLDKALEWNLDRVAYMAAMQMDYERERAQHRWTWNKNLVNPESHKLGTNKSFNVKAFAKNAQNLMKEFTQSYLKQLNSGFGFADALKFATDFMNGAFGKTTSVNNLSFSDYMIFEKSIVSDDPLGATAAGNAMLRDKMNKEFNNSTELSEELRALLDKG